MAETTRAHDKQVLHRMGYAQELSRRMSLFSNFAISFSIICILAGGITAFPVALSAGGGFSVAVGWLVGGLFAMSVALAMGQIASAFPTAGGLYHWGSILGGRAWGWATAWFNLLGLVFVVSSVDVGVWLLFKSLVLTPMFGLEPAWTVTVTSGFDLDMWQLIAVGALLVSQGLINHYGIRLTTRLTDFSGYLIFVVAVVLVGALLTGSTVPLDVGRLVTFANFTGDAGGGVFPATGAAPFAFLLGLLFVCYTITGFDASAHTSEETHDAQVNVPRGMWTAVLVSWVAGFLMVCTFVLVLPTVQEGAGQGWNSFYYLYEQTAMPAGVRAFLSIGIVVANFLCALAGLTSTSRMMFAFARDGGLPASGLLRHVSPRFRTPTYAIWTSVVVAWLSTVYSGAFVVLATGCAVFLYLSYVMPVLAGLLAEGKGWTEKGPFNLGVWSKPVATLAVVGAIVLAITGFFPPNEKVFYLTVAMVVVMVGAWFALESQRFLGVPMGSVIAERQKLIAEIEARYEQEPGR
ncbi:MAG: amino acid permease [Gemmatimonadetes bacterium]|nr:amino acid permease [Gemmatimonadota bacterium]MBK9065685.1 amino acid permease [Gemmatimonadota bacterium]